MLPTPSTSHVNFDQVYEPAEDSYLLLDTLSSASETLFLTERFNATKLSPLVLEVGIGSGVVLAFVTAQSKTIFGRRDVLTLGTDLNSFACRAAKTTIERAAKEAGKRSGTLSDTMNADLTAPIRADSVDVLIFNPPYVPTEELPDLAEHEMYNEAVIAAPKAFERDSHMLALSYAGGKDGMETTDRLLEQLPGVLHTDRGVAYVLLCAQNKPIEVKERIQQWQGGWNAELVGSSGRQAGWEKLQILRIWRG
ncbi:Lethal(2) giant larvae [Venturia nashicola]|uniref:Lethal(2) giant larvae n=1 Tax=Venturia nashicola TaxID=86259 RepID=A0A4Z1NI01_9PEZI|nr:Lethal(2) giant larvae [Venturia nashicola]TLD19998.1 Lethal(2) giant larvae [Venturia nashicola]